MKRNLKHTVVITASGVLLTALVLLVLTQRAFAQAAADGADVRLQRPVAAQDAMHCLADSAVPPACIS
jgi:hypothetical protein